MNAVQARRLLRNLELVFYNITRARDWIDRNIEEMNYLKNSIREVEKELIEAQREIRKVFK